MHKTYTGDTRWRNNLNGTRELYACIREYMIWRCSRCGVYFWSEQKAKEHKHDLAFPTQTNTKRS